MSENAVAANAIGETSSPWGIVASFSSPADLMHALESAVEKGIKKLDAHTPFPVHGLDKVMKLNDSKLGPIVLCHGLAGFSTGLGLQSWAAIVAYPYVISGKPLFSWVSFVPITFELTVLFSAFGAVLGMLALNGLPRFNHPLFNYSNAAKLSSAGFLMSFPLKENNDLTAEEWVNFVQSLHGAEKVEIVYD